MLISTGRRETDALAFNSWNKGAMKMHTVPVCLSAVFGAVVVVALIGQTIWVSTLMQCCHLLDNSDKIHLVNFCDILRFT